MLSFVYYSVCQALALGGLLMVAANAWITRGEAAKRFLAVYCGLALVTMSMTFQNMLGPSLDAPAGLMVALNVSALLGIPLCFYAIPRFCRLFLEHRGQKALLAASAVLAAASLAGLPAGFMAVPSWYIYWVCIPLDIALACVCAYAGVVLRLAAIRHRRGDRSLDAPWRYIFGPIFWLIVVLMPACMVSDLLNLPFSLFHIVLPRAMPLFTAGIAVGWFTASLRDRGRAGGEESARRSVLRAARAADSVRMGSYDWDRYSLSSREREVAELLLAGFPYQAIAEKLFISPATVKSHIIKIYQKTGAKNKLDLLHSVQREGSS